ncbi:MAG: hypothetical protein MUO67_04850 [Anaerolineales bacterium]|nr:hypothetical protein [Anaerolineales bacterium]
MKTKTYLWLLILFTVLISISLACSTLSGSEPDTSLPPAGDEVPTLVPSVTDVPTEAPPPEPAEPAAPEASDPPAPTEIPPEPPSGMGEIESDFPLPNDVQNFMQLDETSINFQTNLSLEEVVDFYRDAFTTQGLTERKLLTVIQDEVVSIVFDGAPNGMAVVLQCVDLDGSTNVNLRFEDV